MYNIYSSIQHYRTICIFFIIIIRMNKTVCASDFKRLHGTLANYRIVKRAQPYNSIRSNASHIFLCLQQNCYVISRVIEKNYFIDRLIILKNLHESEL